jgi:hypothetical protein
MRNLGIIVSVLALTLVAVACAPVSCLGGGTSCNQLVGGGEAETPKAPVAKVKH